MQVAFPPGFSGLLLAAAIGFLIGIERGWRLRDEEAGGRVAGIRTFTLVGLLGGLAGMDSSPATNLLFSILAVGTIAALIVGYSVDMQRDNNVSVTSTLAAILTLGLGALATNGQMALASVGAGAMVIVLASREALHKAIAFTSEEDLQALLRLVLVVFVILPLLPDAALGPYGALNPRRLWMVVVITGSISFIGYVLARWLGQKRGALLTASVGALVSSTAVTVDSARRLREGSEGHADEAAIAIASVLMLGRALLLVAILAPFAFGAIASLIGPAFLVCLLAASILLYRMRGSGADLAGPRLKAPGLGLALLFAVTVAVIAVASAWAQAQFGSASGAVVIALGGTADIDAAIAAVGTMAPDSLPLHEVSLALAAPVLFNTVFKLALLLVIAGWRRSARASAAFAATITALIATIAAAII
jgi:uncharacterized membrane protein (DUF4010 family)